MQNGTGEEYLEKQKNLEDHKHSKTQAAYRSSLSSACHIYHQPYTLVPHGGAGHTLHSPAENEVLEQGSSDLRHETAATCNVIVKRFRKHHGRYSVSTW